MPNACDGEVAGASCACTGTQIFGRYKQWQGGRVSCGLTPTLCRLSLPPLDAAATPHSNSCTLHVCSLLCPYCTPPPSSLYTPKIPLATFISGSCWRLRAGSTEPVLPLNPIQLHSSCCSSVSFSLSPRAGVRTVAVAVWSG